MRRYRAPALRTLVQVRGMPAVRRLPRPQPHFRSFAFRDSHMWPLPKQQISEKQAGGSDKRGKHPVCFTKMTGRSGLGTGRSESKRDSGGNSMILDLMPLDLQPIQRAPIWFTFRFRLGRGTGRLADTVAIAVAMRVRRQVQQQVFADERRKIDNFGAAQLGVDGECGHFDFVPELFQTRNTAQLHRLGERTAGPERTFANPDVELVTKRPGTADLV